MSDQDQLNLEEGSKPELSKQQNDGRNSVFVFANIIVSFLYMILRIVCIIILGGIIIVLYLLVLMILTYPLIASAIKEKGYLLVNVIAITVDPLFFYYPVLNDENKCIHFDKSLGITATVLRSFLDSLKLFYITRKLRKNDSRLQDFFSNLCGLEYSAVISRHKKSEKGNEFLKNEEAYVLLLVDFLAILPIPQLLVIFGIRGPEFSTSMIFFLVQYVPRVIRTFFLFTQGVSGTLADATWAIVAFYICLYMQGGHVFGALWYYYAIGKATACWKRACINHTECADSSFLCHDNSSQDSNFLNDFCSINSGSITSYNFGLYNDALQSRVVEETYFPKKLLRCLKWGLQNLSAFGQSLQTSNDVWENIFAICMTMLGVVLFVFLVGKMQSDTIKSRKINEKWQQITQSPYSKDIDKNVKGQMRRDKRKNWQNKRIQVDSFVSDLSEDTAREVKFRICRKQLVEVFKNWPENFLKELCKCLKPVLFMERTHIIQEGDPIDEMIFVLDGKIWTYSNASKNEPPKDGDLLCGEELIAWASQNESSSSKLPISTKTYQAYTNIEAFALLSHDLKRLSLLKRNVCFVQDRWRWKNQRREKYHAEMDVDTGMTT